MLCYSSPSKLTKGLFTFRFVMVNFMSQLDWAMGCPDNLVKHYFSVCLWGCFLMRCTLELVDRVKQTVLPMWVGITSSAEDMNIRNRQRKAEFSVWAKTWSSSALTLGLGPLNLDWDLYHWPSWFPGFGFGLELHHGFRSFQLSEGISWDFSASIILWANPL